MKYYRFLLLLFCSLFAVTIKAQINSAKTDKVVKDTIISLSKKTADTIKKAEDFPINMYQIITYKRDTVSFDTTLTVYREYKHNYLRKDDFELLPFSNVGQTYNILGLINQEKSFYPRMGHDSKHHNYMEAEAINYYSVPTPTTELFYRTVMEQGQVLDAFFTLNTSKQLNFSIAYKGTRSLGKYQHILSSAGNFRFTTNFQSKKGRYLLRAHYTSQNVKNEENGGLAIPEQFTSGNSEFIDRSRIDVKFENAENLLLGKRYFLDHEIYLTKKHDSLIDHVLSVGHEFSYETKNYEFKQATANQYFGEAYESSDLHDMSKLKVTNNLLKLKYENTIVGKTVFLTKFYKYNYFYNSIVVVSPDEVITNQLRDTEIALGGTWKKNIGTVAIEGALMQNIRGNYGGTLFDANIDYSFNQDLKFHATFHSSNRMPNFNFLLYQSDYKAYNWQNFEKFKKQKLNTIEGAVASKKWGELSIAYSINDNHTYFKDTAFSLENTKQLVTPMQYGKTINMLKVKFQNDLRFFKRWGLANTIMYQNVDQQENIINVPEFTTRNTLYYSNHVFKKAMFLQTGITVKYFSKYYMNSYSPILGELLVQDQEKIGNFPMLDFFINAKVNRMRIFLKAEHTNSFFNDYDFYSAPNYPYRDFIVRMGIIWNFFS